MPTKGLSPYLRQSMQGKPTKVMFFFDTEDYTCDRSNDAIRDIANTLAAEGVRGNFNVVGFLALRLLELHRTDVVEALKAHVVGTQTLYHSRHPTIAELAEDPDYSRAYARTMADEAKAVGLLEAAFGEGRVKFACPPGNSVSAVAMDAYADLGIRFNAGTGFYGGADVGMLVRPGTCVDGLWFANQVHLPYYTGFTLEDLIPAPGKPEPDIGAILDDLARYDFAGLFMHPHMAVKTRHWDGPNYLGANLAPWRQWRQVDDRAPADTAEFYRRLGRFVRRIADDPRFKVTDVDEYAASLKPRKAIGRAELAVAKASLERSLSSVKPPHSWCVADVFHAAVKMLRGEDVHMPGAVHGFLEPPQPAGECVDVSANELAEAAKSISLDGFLPSVINVGGKSIGPADFLFAALTVLVDGAPKAVVEPGRNQLGSFGEVPSLKTFSLAGGWCIHPGNFTDEWVSHRLRLQLWTLRLED